MMSHTRSLWPRGISVEIYVVYCDRYDVVSIMSMIVCDCVLGLWLKVLTVGTTVFL